MKKTLELEQKNELLADKGEIIDGLRAECQERRETERYTKHRIGKTYFDRFEGSVLVTLYYGKFRGGGGGFLIVTVTFGLSKSSTVLISAQLDKKLAEEAESYHQIISDLQSQLSGYTNAHIQ